MPPSLSAKECDMSFISTLLLHHRTSSVRKQPLSIQVEILRNENPISYVVDAISRAIATRITRISLSLISTSSRRGSKNTTLADVARRSRSMLKASPTFQPFVINPRQSRMAFVETTFPYFVHSHSPLACHEFFPVCLLVRELEILPLRIVEIDVANVEGVKVEGVRCIQIRIRSRGVYEFGLALRCCCVRTWCS